MTLHQLNEEMLNEISIDEIKSKVKKLGAELELGLYLAKDSLNKFKTDLKSKLRNLKVLANGEFEDNKEAFDIIKKQITSIFKNIKAVSEKDVRTVINQMQDNVRIAFLIGIGVAPGGSIAAIPIKILANKLNIRIIPENNKKELPTI